MPGSQNSSQFFLDAANRMYEEMPDAEEGERYLAFLDEYGDDAYMWWTSNSENATGIPANSKAFKAQQANADLIRDHPELGLAIVGTSTMDEPFNYFVYQSQEEAGERTRLEPAEAQARAEAKKGWEEWRALNTALDAELAFRGLRSISQKGAVDLAYIKEQKRQQLKELYPGWREDFEQFDTGRGYRLIDNFRDIIRSGNSPNPHVRPDWRGVADYLEIHDMIAAELDYRATMGGSRDINAIAPGKSNADLKYIWDQKVGELVQSNLEFADLYHVMLENHDLSMGSGL